MRAPLVLKTNEKPSFFNKEAAIGFFAAPVIGTIVGSYIGKKRMENEAANGKLVGEPTAINKESLLGGLIGLTAGTLIALTAATTAPILALSALITVPIVGAFIGGRQGKINQEEEYNQALKQNGHEQVKSNRLYVIVEKEPTRTKSFQQQILEERARSAAQSKEI